MSQKRDKGQHRKLSLMEDEISVVNRLASLFPEGTTSFNRIGRMCLLRGAAVLEAEMTAPALSPKAKEPRHG